MRQTDESVLPARATLLRSTLAMLVASVGQRAIGLMGIVVLARILDARGLGSYTFTQSIAQTFAGWSRTGLDLGLQVSLSADTDHKRQAAMIGQSLTLTAIIAFVVAATLLLTADIVAGRLFSSPDLTPYVAPAATMFVALMLFGVIYSVLAGLGAFQEHARATLQGSIVSLAATASGAIMLGAVGAAWGLAIGQASMATFAYAAMVRVLRAHNIALAAALPGREVLDVLSRGLPYFLSTLFLLPVDFAALGLLARAGGIDALGELRVTQAIMSAASVLPTAIMGPILTHLAAEYAGARGEAGVRQNIRRLWSLTLPLAMLIAGVWPLAVDVVAGQGYPMARHVGDLALVGFVPAMLLSVLHGALMARGKSSASLLMVGAVQAAMVFAAAWLIIPGHGLAGYLAAQAAGFATAALVAVMAWGGLGVLVGTRVAVLVALTLVLYAALLLDLVYPVSLPVRLMAAFVGTITVGVLAYAFLLTPVERARLTGALGAAWRRLRRPRPASPA